MYIHIKNQVLSLFNVWLCVLINIIVERINIVNTICLPVDSLGETWDNKAVSVAGWGFTKILEEGEWHPKVEVGQGMYHYSITDYWIFNHISFWARREWHTWNFQFSGINPADKLQVIDIRVMPLAQCKYAHRRRDTPVIEGNNVCAGGEEGLSMLTHCLITKIR